MAKQYGNIDSKALLTLDKTFSRANGQPLDSTTLWYSMEAAQDYAKGNAAYIGQIITVIENDIIKNYSIINAAGDLEEVGKKLVWSSFTEEA